MLTSPAPHSLVPRRLVSPVRLVLAGAAGDVNAQGSSEGSADGSAGGVYPGGISGGGTGGGSLGQSGVSAASGGVSSQAGRPARTGFGAVSVAVGGALVLGAGTVMVLRSRRRAS